MITSLLIFWFGLWGFMWAMYFMLDGFDFGIGIAYPFLAKDEKQRLSLIHSFAPLWDGNEVWLITVGALTFAAFPTAYAYLFSFLYTPLILILFALIIRGVSLEFRAKLSHRWQKTLCDIGLFVGSLVPSFLFGVAFGNLFIGLPIDDQGYKGSLLSLLNFYSIIVGILFVVTFVVHGLLWIAIRNYDPLKTKALNVAKNMWYLELVLAVLFLILSAFYTTLYNNFLNFIPLSVFLILCVLSLFLVQVLIFQHNEYGAFISSCAFIMLLVICGVIGMYPNLIKSSISEEFSYTLLNSSSSVYTLTIMTIVVVIFIPLTIIYQGFVYKTFMYKITDKDLNIEY